MGYKWKLDFKNRVRDSYEQKKNKLKTLFDVFIHSL